MDATYLSGNERIMYLYATVSKVFFSSSIRREIVWVPLAWVVMHESICLYTMVSVSCESMPVQPAVYGSVSSGYWNIYMLHTSVYEGT